MTLTIPDEVLRQTGMTERGLLVEVACRLFAAEKLSLHFAGRLAGLSRAEMEAALLDRKIPIYHLTVEELRREVEGLKRSEM